MSPQEKIMKDAIDAFAADAPTGTARQVPAIFTAIQDCFAITRLEKELHKIENHPSDTIWVAAIENKKAELKTILSKYNIEL